MQTTRNTEVFADLSSRSDWPAHKQTNLKSTVHALGCRSSLHAKLINNYIIVVHQHLSSAQSSCALTEASVFGWPANQRGSPPLAAAAASSDPFAFAVVAQLPAVVVLGRRFFKVCEGAPLDRPGRLALS